MLKGHTPGGKTGIRRNREKILQNEIGSAAYGWRLDFGYSWKELGPLFNKRPDAIRRLAQRWAEENRSPWPIPSEHVTKARNIRIGRKYYQFMEAHGLSILHAARAMNVGVDKFKIAAQSYAEDGDWLWPPYSEHEQHMSYAPLRAYEMRKNGMLWKDIARILHYTCTQNCREAVHNMCQKKNLPWPIKS